MDRRRISNVIWGLILIAAGVVLIGHMAGLWNVEIFIRGWWTIFLIAPAIVSMVSYGLYFHNIFLLFLGVWLFLNENGLLGKNGWTMFPAALLIIAGIFILLGRDGFGHHHHHHHDFDIDDSKHDNIQ